MIDPAACPEARLDASVCRRILHSGEGYSVTYMTAVPGPGAPAHSHPHAQFIFLLQGSGLFSLDAQTIALRENQALAIPPNAPHSFLHFDRETVWLEFFAPERQDLA